MSKQKPFSFQLFVMAGFLFFFYMFYALARAIYDTYEVESGIKTMQEEVDFLSELMIQKPKELEYYQSPQYHDLHGKTSRDLLNLGEKLIIISSSNELVEQGPADLLTEELAPDSILNQPNHVQWWDYFFGQKSTMQAPPVESREIIEEEG